MATRVPLRIRAKHEAGNLFTSLTIQLPQASKDAAPEKHSVRQFMYTAWPDFGVPKSANVLDDLISAVRRWNNEQGGGECPILVHCSAGVGRSVCEQILEYHVCLAGVRPLLTASAVSLPQGTYMVVDYGRYLQSQNLPFDKLDDWVKELRDQRHGMVQTLEQYAWCYFALGVCLIKHS